MPKRKLKDIAEEKEIPFEEAFDLAKSKLAAEDLTGRGKATWVSEDGQAILEEALDIPEIVPKHYKARVIHGAPNKNYVYAYIKEISKKVPVVIGRLFVNKCLIGKNIDVEAIADNKGVSYRHIAKKRT